MVVIYGLFAAVRAQRAEENAGRAELIAALVEAVFIEIPFAVLCLRLARLRVGGAGWAS